MKKFLLFLAVLTVGLTVVACSQTTTAAPTTAAPTTAAPTTAAPTTAAPTTAAPTTAAPTTAAPKTIVTYCGWNVGTVEQNNLFRRTIADFNAQSTTIEIEIVEPSGDYNAFLATMAAAETFPDIVMANNVPDHIIKEYAADITAVAEADDEWEDIPVALRDAITYDGHVFAIPSGMFYLGLFANLTLIEDSGIVTDFTQYDYTVAEWIEAVEEATDTTRLDGTSTAGIVHPGDFINFMPHALDQESATPLGIGHFALADNAFLFNSQAVKDALTMIASIVDQGWSVSAYSDAGRGTVEAPLPSVRQELFGDNWDGRAFRTGQVAFTWGGSWDSAGLADEADGLFDLQFVGVPGSAVVGVSDFITVSKTTANLEAAYEVAKWLTFGADGIENRFDLIEDTVPDTANGEVSLSVNGLPINTNQAIIDAWFVDYPVAGVQEYFEWASSGDVDVLVEGNKYVPGFITARYTYNTGIEGATTSRPYMEPGQTLSIGDLIWDAASNLIVYEDYMTAQLQDSINYQFIVAKLEMDAAIDD